MCGGGGGGAPAKATYKSLDGKTWDDPNQAANRDRQIQLAAAMGGEGSSDYQRYDSQGLTAADYRAEQRLREQEAQAKAAEEQRKASIAASRGAVDTSFNTFDDNYFKGIS